MSSEQEMPVVACGQCGAIGIPPQYVCRKCGQMDLHDTTIPGIGTIYTHTTIRVAPEAYRDQAPYDIAIVELAPDLRITARILAEKAGAVRVGDRAAFQRADDNGYWFKII